MSTQTPDKDLKTAAEGKEEMVTISKSELQGLIKRIEIVEDGQHTMTKPLKRVTEHHAKMRVMDGLPVVGYGNAYHLNPENRKSALQMKVQLQKPDGKLVEKIVDYLTFKQEVPSETVKVVKRYTERFETSDIRQGGGGQQYRVDVNNDMATPELIELMHTYIEEEADVEFLTGPITGEVLHVKINALNQ